MYKGYKVTKHLQRYMGYAKCKYERLNMHGEVNLWEVIEGYKLIMEYPKWVQLYVYDWITGMGEYNEAYDIQELVNGGIYIKKAA